MMQMLAQHTFRLYAEQATIQPAEKDSMANAELASMDLTPCPQFARFVAVPGSALWSALPEDLNITLAPLEVLEPNGCTRVPYIPVKGAGIVTHGALVKVAGFDKAVFGFNATDAVVKGYKRSPVFNEEDRYYLVGSCRYVDEVLRDAPMSTAKDFLDENAIDTVVVATPGGAEVVDKYHFAAHEAGKLRFLPRTDGVSTTSYISKVVNEYGQEVKTKLGIVQRGGGDANILGRMAIDGNKLNATPMPSPETSPLPEASP